MQIVIDIPNAPINDYRDLYYKIHGMAASEGLYDKVKSQRALALKVVLNVLEGVVEGTPLPKEHGRLIDADALIKQLEAMANNRWNIQVGASKGLEEAIDIVDDAPTIIEAESEDEE